MYIMEVITNRKWIMDVESIQNKILWNNMNLNTNGHTWIVSHTFWKESCTENAIMDVESIQNQLLQTNMK